MQHLNSAITQVACSPLHCCACRTCSSIKAPGQSGSLGTWEAGEEVVIPSVDLPIGARPRRMRSLPGVYEVLFAQMVNQIMQFFGWPADDDLDLEEDNATFASPLQLRMTKAGAPGITS